MTSIAEEPTPRRGRRPGIRPPPGQMGMSLFGEPVPEPERAQDVLLDFPTLFEQLADIPAHNPFAVTQNPANRIAWQLPADGPCPRRLAGRRPAHLAVPRGRTLRPLRCRSVQSPAHPVGRPHLSDLRHLRERWLHPRRPGPARSVRLSERPPFALRPAASVRAALRQADALEWRQERLLLAPAPCESGASVLVYGTADRQQNAATGGRGCLVDESCCAICWLLWSGRQSHNPARVALLRAGRVTAQPGGSRQRLAAVVAYFGDAG